MLSFALRRIIALLVTLAVATVVVFTVLEVLPGDPAQVMLGTEARPDTLAALRDKLGLNQPAPERYLHWVAGLVTGDLGVSYTYATPVAELVRDRLAVSLPLAVFALALTTLIAIPLGAWAAARPMSTSSKSCSVAATPHSSFTRPS